MTESEFEEHVEGRIAYITRAGCTWDSKIVISLDGKEFVLQVVFDKEEQ